MFNIITVPCTPGVFKVRYPDDYRKWLVSMFTLFGTKWVKIFCGPMWKIMSTSQSVPEPRHGGLDPLEVLFIELRCYNMYTSCFSLLLQARVNVPGLSERTLERDIVSSGISLGSEVQVYNK